MVMLIRMRVLVVPVQLVKIMNSGGHVNVQFRSQSHQIQFHLTIKDFVDLNMT